ncbi:MAG: hypothetical protein Q9227_007635 [Pyrenula ochraceoflavens]
MAEVQPYPSPPSQDPTSLPEPPLVQTTPTMSSPDAANRTSHPSPPEQDSTQALNETPNTREAQHVAASEPSRPQSSIAGPETSQHEENTNIDASTVPEADAVPQESPDSTQSVPPSQPEPDENQAPVESSESVPPPAPADTEDAPQPPADDPEPAAPPPEENAYWVDYKEDTSSPDEDELKEIENDGNEVSALDYKYHEDQIYSDLDDPEYRPSKKIRISWTIKGVRGTKERPNFARIMHSPSAQAGGYFWKLKFFPRGNSSQSFSCYIKCSKEPITDDEEMPETKFHWVEGPGDELLAEGEKKGNLSFPATPPKEKKVEKPTSEENAAAESSDASREDSENPDQNQASDADNAESKEPSDKSGEQPAVEESWRVPAQIGVVVYNPSEPRTNHHNSSCHQFNKGNDDWGWTNFFQPQPWEKIHLRQKGQRQALLRDDTLAFDAYIRLFDDPTQRLWFHPSDSESFWDGVTVTGYRALGTPPLRYSPGVAGLSALFHLSPIRSLIQNAASEDWTTDPAVKQKPILSASQIVLYLMRKQRKNVPYVDVYPLLNYLSDFGERFQDVLTFWERFRRCIEFECSDKAINEQFSEIFDIQPKDPASPIQLDPLSRQQATLSISCRESSSISEGLSKLNPTDYEDKILPHFLTVDLGRQQFEYERRSWKLHYNRVRLNEDLDLSSLVPHQAQSKYTLYGFVVHAAERTSQQFYTIVRPDGPGTRWLAFEDGDGNKILIQTKKMLAEFEGLEGDELRDNSSFHHTVYLAMYIRTDLISQYLPGKFEHWDTSRRLKMHHSVRSVVNEEDSLKDDPTDESEIKISVQFARSIEGYKGFLDANVLKAADPPTSRMVSFEVPYTTTYFELRNMLAKSQGIDDVRKIRFWSLSHSPPLQELGKTVHRVTAYTDAVGSVSKFGHAFLWVYLLDENVIDLYGISDPQPKPPKKDKNRSKAEGDEGDASGDNTESAATATEPPNNAELPAEPSSNAELPTTPPNNTELPIEVYAETREENPAGNQEARADSTESQDQSDPMPAPTEVPQDSLEDTSTQPSGVQQQLPSDPPDQTADNGAQPEEVDNVVVDEAQQETHHSQEAPAAAPEPVPENPSAEPDLPSSEDSESGQQTPPSPQETGDEQVSEETEAMLSEAAIRQILAEEVATLDAAVSNPDTTTPPPSNPNAPEPDSHNDDAVVADPDADPQPPSNEDEQAQPDSATESPANTGDTDDVASVHSDTSTESNAEPSLEPHAYRFLQIFDAENQEIRTAGSFIAKKDSSVKETVRAFLEWPAEKSLQLWYLEAPYRTKPISNEAKFEHCDAVYDSSVILVGEVLTEDHSKTGNLFGVNFADTGEEASRPTYRPRMSCRACAEMLKRNHMLQVEKYYIEALACIEGFLHRKTSLLHLTSSQNNSVTYTNPLFSLHRKSSLHALGKFSNPRSMLNNHWLRARHHPTANYSGDITLRPFGRHYYSGTMLNGRFHGHGTHISNTGHQYTGHFIQENRSGQGHLISPNGDEYTGTFLKNERHGEGTFVEKRTGNKYVGGFKEDKRSGKGVTYWEVAEEDEKLCQICYGEAQDALFYDCGHVCACLECARQVDVCPICRRGVKGVVRIFYT